jgi:phosphatidylinositol-3-phosphatase
MRSLLDIRLSRFSLAVLAAVSVAATVVIITNGTGHTAAQLTALAALREPVAKAQTPTPAAPASPGTTSNPTAPGDSGSSGSGSGASSPASGTDSGADSGSGSDGGTDSSDTGSDTGGGTDTSGSGDDGTTPATTTTPTAASNLPKVSHVFEIALSTTSYAAAFADKSAAPYLHSLEAKGTVLRGYESLGHGELADYLATVSGQEPNAATSAGCTTYQEFRTGAVAKSNGLVPGNGCVYPETALTIGDQVTAKGATWRAYIADMGKQTCSHPDSGAVDDAVLPGTESGYDTHHNPFVYFHSLLDLGDCASDDQDLTHLSSALAHKSAAAKLSFIAPGACEDAAATTTTDPTTTTTPSSTTSSISTTSSTLTTSTQTTTSTAPETTTTPTTSTTATESTPTDATPAPAAGCPAGQPVGIAAEDVFLKRWVPRILASPAYKDDGVLILAFAGERGHHPGGASRTGALVISPHTTKGKVVSTAYEPYSLLRSVEDMLGYTALARAQAAPSFAQAVLHKNL